MVSRTSDLDHLFDTLNEIFFRGRLPRYRVRHRRERFPGDRGACDPKRRTIYVGRFDANLTRQVILHEMCHIGTPGHGRRFQEKLNRLARMGEAWAAKESESYLCAVERPLAGQIREAITNLAVDARDLSWPKAVRILANRVSRTPSELLRIAPWARRVWERERDEELEAERQSRVLAVRGRSEP